MKKIVSFLFIALLLIGCDHEGTTPPPVIPETPEEPVVEQKDFSLTPIEKQISQQNNLFAFELLKTVYKNEIPGKNILISPLSASLALGMLNNGAGGITHEEMQRVLGYKDISREAMNGYFQKMIEIMHEIDPDVAFRSANSIWIENQFPVLDAFIDTNKTFYDAEVRNENFSDPETVNLINNWCSEKTEGTIPEILDHIDANAVMYLINALYFNGSWTVPFDKELTTEETFYNQNRQERSVPMMNHDMLIYYGENNVFKLAELPYGNEAFSMVFILPHEDVSIASAIDELEEGTFYRKLATDVLLKIPRFKIDYERSLSEDLREMGLQSMFGNDANFSLIHPTEPLIVSNVLQKTFIEITEEGTDASAASGVEIGYGSYGGEEEPLIYTFYLNRPFIYLIREKDTGTIFFMGVVENL
ncbi:serpin family protein [Parabacteroides sp. PF5-9]|uniref:serpin family protein n=1 Tax=Parabacteroides sp. PF5-9 TaxID=1742404 RepID=UPI002473F54F|nr:serpin family protein [Parabacteroides sp. PF5-9]